MSWGFFILFIYCLNTAVTSSILALPGTGLYQVKAHEETLSEAVEILIIISL